jgi:hypothetical protein
MRTVTVDDVTYESRPAVENSCKGCDSENTGRLCQDVPYSCAAAEVVWIRRPALNPKIQMLCPEVKPKIVIRIANGVVQLVVSNLDAEVLVYSDETGCTEHDYDGAVQGCTHLAWRYILSGVHFTAHNTLKERK